MFNRIEMAMVILALAQPGITAPAEADDISIEWLDVLLGEWRGVGDGKWGENSAERTYSMVLDGTFVQGHWLLISDHGGSVQ